MQSEVDELQRIKEEKERKKAQRAAEMEQLLNQLEGKLSKNQRKRANSSDLAMVMKM